MPQFNIGDIVYQAHAGMEKIWVVCPECLGSGRLRVILGDESEVSIACVCCYRGYEGGSPGKISTYEFQANTQESIVQGIETRLVDGVIRSRVCFAGGYFSEDQNVFATREEAQHRSNELALEHAAEEAKKLKYKEKDHKTWAWNVSYWKAEIRRAKAAIYRCEARLAVAPKNIKEEDSHG